MSGVIVLPQRLNNQPQVSLPVDYAGLAKGARILLNPAMGSGDLVTGATWALNGTANLGTSGLGKVYGYPGSADYLSITGYNDLSSNTGTLAIWFPVVGASNLYGHVLAGSQSPGVFAPQVQSGLTINIPGPGSSSSSLPFWYNTTNTSLVISFGGTAANQRAYLNGVDSGLRWSGSAPNGWGAGSKTIWIGGYPAGTGWCFTGSILCFLWTDAIWGQGEAQKFHNTKGGALFKAQPRRIYVASAGGGVALSGQALTSSVGILVPSNSVSITGNVVASAQGTLTPSTATLVALTGQSLASAAGVLKPNNSVSLSGAQLSAAVGSLTVAIAGSVALTGQGVGIATGNLVPLADIRIPLIGLPISSSQGTITAGSPDVTVSLTGVAIAASAGTLSTTGVVAQTGGHYGPIIRKKDKRRHEPEDDIRSDMLEKLEDEIDQPDIPEEIKQEAERVIEEIKAAPQDPAITMQDFEYIRELLGDNRRRQQAEDEELLFMLM